MKKVKYPNLDDYDLSAYEELKGDILYRINGGSGAMTEADRAAMAEACKNGDKDKQAEILSKYENKEDATTTPTNTNTPAAPKTTPQTTQTTTTTESTQSTADTGSSTTKTTTKKTTTTTGGSTSTPSSNTTTNTNNNTAGAGNKTTNNNGYPNYINPENKTVDANINSNRSVEEAFSAYYILSDKGYKFRLVDGSNVVHTFSSVEAAENYVRSLEITIPKDKSVKNNKTIQAGVGIGVYLGVAVGFEIGVSYSEKEGWDVYRTIGGGCGAGITGDITFAINSSDLGDNKLHGSTGNSVQIGVGPILNYTMENHTANFTGLGGIGVGGGTLWTYTRTLKGDFKDFCDTIKSYQYFWGENE